MATTQAVRRKYNFLAKIYDRIYASYVRKTVQSAFQAISLRGGEKILDIGCGTGELEKALLQKNPNLSIVGVDISSDMLAVAQNKLAGFSNITLKEGDFLNVALPENFFDAAFSLSNFHYFPKPQATLKKTDSLLKKNGTLVIIDWNRRTLKGKIYNAYMRLADPAFVKAYTPKEISEMLGKAGFVVERTDYFKVGLLWQMMRVVAKKT